MADDGRFFVGVVQVDCYLPGSGSLKAKRAVLNKAKAALRRDLDVSVAEVGYQDLWQRSRILFSMAGSDPSVVEKTMDASLEYLYAGDWQVVSCHEELIEIDA